MTHPVYQTLIRADQLAERLAHRPMPVLLDASFDLADPSAGERAYRAEHVPGSHHVDLDRDLCAARTGRNGRHPLPERTALARTMGRLGITPATQVVVLDRQGSVYAARLWWMLRWMGHAAVAVLDGGLAAWRDSGGPVTAEASAAPQPVEPYPTRESLAGTIDASALASRLDALTLIDARSAERYRGETEPIDPVAGHIPGALNRFHRSNLGPDGRFKSPDALRREFTETLAGRPASEVVHSCGSGVTACHNLLAMEHAGLAGSLLYPGSWSEWSADPGRPVARG